MARMKIGSKDKAKQPEKSYAVSMQTAPMEEKEPEVVEKIVEVEKVVEKIVEVPVRLDSGSTETVIVDNSEDIERLEQLMDARTEEISDLVENALESVKSQDKRLKEVEIEIDRELASNINDLQTEMLRLSEENVRLNQRMSSIEMSCAGLVIVCGLIILMVMSI